ncbi:MAG TPA: hypothetical protein VFQ39_15410, partial [Longimicrobium sp.]|nr:hypothetical protein [Longimicrobium sp.]
PEISFARRLAAGRTDALDLLHLALAAFGAAIWALAAYGALVSRGPRAARLLALGVAAYSIAVAGGVGEPRFRIAALPVLCALAGAGAVHVWERIAAARRHRPEPSGAG